jgi:hypothetical protein
LTEELAQRLAPMRARLAERSARHHQLSQEHVESVTGLQGMAIALGLTMWILFGGMAAWLALDHDVPLAQFVAGDVEPGDLGLEWWVLWSVVTGLPLSLLGFGVALLRLRSVGVEALPLPPAHAGAAPRCRACAAELPSGSAIRRCRFCSSDNLIAGTAYRRGERALDDALADIARAFDLSLALRIRRAERWLFVGSMWPIAALILVPIVGLFVSVNPDLYKLTGALWALSILVLVAAIAKKLPSVSVSDGANEA